MTDYTVTGAVAGVPIGIKPQIIEVVLDVFAVVAELGSGEAAVSFA
jgi:hypothetical protein